MTEKTISNEPKQSSPTHRLETPVSREFLDELREYYEEPEIPSCRICGAKMTLYAAGPDGVTYYCSAVKYIGGTKEEKKHFSDSRCHIYNTGDDRVIKLIDVYEKLIGG